MKSFFDVFSRRRRSTLPGRDEYYRQQRREAEKRRREREHDEAERRWHHARREAVWDAILGPDRSPAPRPRGEAPLARALKAQAAILFSVVAVFWGLELVDQLLLGGSLDALGIRPRTVDGLWGILLAPFLHGGFGHVLANTVPFVVLGWLIMLRETWHFFAVAVIVAVLGGLGVWLVAPAASVHIGASGVIFGFFGFLLFSGWFERRIGTILISVLVAATYGGLIFGVLPGQPGVSWQSHLFGFLAGVVAAWFLARRPATARAAR
jgi:membrane associated rhomboid family serine protease